MGNNSLGGWRCILRLFGGRVGSWDYCRSSVDRDGRRKASAVHRAILRDPNLLNSARIDAGSLVSSFQDLVVCLLHRLELIQGGLSLDAQVRMLDRPVLDRCFELGNFPKLFSREFGLAMNDVRRYKATIVPGSPSLRQMKPGRSWLLQFEEASQERGRVVDAVPGRLSSQKIPEN